MSLSRVYWTWTLLTATMTAGVDAGLSPARAADGDKKVTYQEALGVFRARCMPCHNGDQKKGGLVLDTYLGVMQGGGSGEVIEPGDASASTLYLLAAHEEEPRMPPNGARIPDAELAILKQWIDAGAPENAGSAMAAPKKPNAEFKLDPAAVGKPQGDPATPDPALVSTNPPIHPSRPGPILALAASPWAPIVAVGSHKQVVIYRTDGTRRLAAVLPFPEGTIHTLRFSRSGDLLLGGGGRGGESGLAVVWNVKTGERLFEVGRDKEYDVVLAADISPDQSLVAVGGPNRIVRVYDTSTGEPIYEIRKHTEWITALEFSPDGVLLASGDRNNGLLVWEALNGREFFDLRGHSKAITGVSWRADSNVLASASLDGTVRLWEMTNGGQIKAINAHGGGVEGIHFALDGRIATAGRDNRTRLWNANGDKIRDFDPLPDLGLQAVLTHDGQILIGADFSGVVRLWNAESGQVLADLAANPAPLPIRLEQTAANVAEAEAQANQLEAGLSDLRAAVAAAEQAVKAAETTLAQRAAELAQAQAEANKATQIRQQAEAAQADAANATQAAQQALQALDTANATHERAMAETQTALAQTAAAIDHARVEVETALAAKAQADQALTQAVADLKAADPTQVAQAAQVVIQRRREVQARVEAIDQAAFAVLTQDGTRAHLTAALAQTQRDLAALPARRAEAEAALNAARTELAKRAEAVKQAVAQADALAQTLAQAQNAHDQARAVVEKAKADQAAVAKTFADKSAPLDAVRQTLAALKTDLELLQAESKRSAAGQAALAK